MKNTYTIKDYTAVQEKYNVTHTPQALAKELGIEAKNVRYIATRLRALGVNIPTVSQQIGTITTSWDNGVQRAKIKTEKGWQFLSKRDLTRLTL